MNNKLLLLLCTITSLPLYSAHLHSRGKGIQPHYTNSKNKHAPLSQENILKKLFLEHRLFTEPTIIEFPMFSKPTMMELSKTITHFSQHGNAIVMMADDFEETIDDLDLPSYPPILYDMRYPKNPDWHEHFEQAHQLEIIMTSFHKVISDDIKSKPQSHHPSQSHEITNTLPNKPNTQNYQKKQLYNTAVKPFKIKNNYKNQNRRTIHQPKRISAKNKKR